MRFLVITLKGPMMSFAGPVIDGISNTARLPGLSCLTGLLGNALGYHRHHYDALEALQGAITFAAREDVAGIVQDEFQTAMVRGNDKGWTRMGVEGRAGGDDTYQSPLIRRRPYLADHVVTVVLGLSGIDLTVEDVAGALLRPAGCLYLGRKGFLPSTFLVHGGVPHFIEAEDALEALKQAPVLYGDPNAKKLAAWPRRINEGHQATQHDIRNYRSGRHTGKRFHKEGRISVNAA
jgi:CRISPR system Cascade subunit CasD